jgi:hypothetical protein
MCNVALENVAVGDILSTNRLVQLSGVSLASERSDDRRRNDGSLLLDRLVAQS